MSIRKNTLYNICGAIIPLALSLITVPIYLSVIGEARYGVLAVAWLLLGYFGLFDLGLGRATAQQIASLREATSRLRAQTFWTALLMNVGLGVVGGIVLWPVATYFFSSFFKVEEVLRPEMIVSVPWLVLTVPVATLSGVLTGALQGREKFLELNIISVIGTVFFQLFPLTVACFIGPELFWLLPAALFSRLAAVFLLLWRCQRHVFGGHRPTFIRDQAAGLLRFGGWVTVTSLIGPMMVILDRFAIGTISGAKFVTYYTVPFQFASKTNLISVALSSSLFPRFAAVNGDEARELSKHSLKTLLLVMSPLVLLGIFLMQPFLDLWLGQDFSDRSALIGQILLLGFWANGFAQIPYALLQARNRPDLVAKCHMIEVVPYLGLLYLGLHYLGLPGAALAFALRALVDFIILARLSGILLIFLRLSFFPLFLLLGGLLTTNIIALGSTEWLISVVVLALATFIWVWNMAPDSLRITILSRIIPSFFLR